MRRAQWLAAILLMLTLSLVGLAACGSDTSTGTTSGASPETTEQESTAPESLQLTGEDSGGTFEVQAGGLVELSLQANPSTGYAWEMDDPDPEASLLEQAEEPKFEPDNAEAVGSAGTMTFTFRAVDRGEMTVRMIYLPPSAEALAEETFEIRLIVR